MRAEANVVLDLSDWEIDAIRHLLSRKFSRLIDDVTNGRTSVRAANLVEYEALIEKLERPFK